MMTKMDLLRHVQATAEIYGRSMSPESAEVYIEDLASFNPEAAIAALAKCRRELRTFPTLNDIVTRIPDSRPGVAEAWAMIPKDEEGSVVWCEEMAQAYGIARMATTPFDQQRAFQEKYTELLAHARLNGIKARWTPSFGFEALGRIAAVDAAVTARRISNETALALLPNLSDSEAERLRLPELLKKLQLKLPEMPK